MANSFILQIFFASSVFFIVILAWTILKTNRRLISRLFFLLTIILDIWLIGRFMVFSQQIATQVLFWDRFVYIGVVFWPIIQYHFGLSITRLSPLRRRLLVFGYILSSLFAILSQTDYFFGPAATSLWNFYTHNQPVQYLFALFFLVYILLFFYILLKKYIAETNYTERYRLLYFIFGFTLLNFIGGLVFFPVYSVSIYPIFLVIPLIISLILTYSTVYFGLVNIKLILRNYFVYFLAFNSYFVPAYLFLYWVNNYHPLYLFFASIFVYLFVLLTFHWVKKYYYRLANRYFFSSLYDFNQLIYHINSSLHASFDIDRILKEVMTHLKLAFHSKAVAACTYNEDKEQLIIHHNQDFKFKPNKKLVVDFDKLNSILIQAQPQSIKDLRAKLGDQSCQFLNYLDSLQAEWLLPLRIKSKKTLSLMIFSSKESGEPYNLQDLKVLEIIAIDVGMVMDNIFLYQNIKKFNQQLKQEIKKATNKLQEQNQALKKLDKMKDEFVSIVSHQMRTPLTGIRWLLEILISNKNKNLDKEQVKMLQQINSSNLNLIKLINDLLNISRLEAGHKFSITRRRFFINELLAEVLQENSFLIGDKKLKVINQIPANLQIKADRDKLKQVWQNLISNACKYSKQRSAIKISVDQAAKKFIFNLQDNGIGVPVKQQTLLFTKFFRADNANSQHPEGSGLGLYIAREIIRAHGGDLMFKPARPTGSIFYFSLPK